MLACGSPAGGLSEAALSTAAAPLPIVLTTPGLESAPNQTEVALTRHIRSAQDTIDVAVYDFGLALPARAMSIAADNGVAVRVVTDGDELDEDGILMLQENGIEVAFRPEGDRIMHHKFVVIDGKRVITGSANFTNFSARWIGQDLDLVVD